MNNLTILKLDHFGRGIARIDHDIYFISGALPGDIVNVEIIKNKKNIKEGIVKEYISKSILHKESKCKYFNVCGGCTFLNLDYQEELKFKEMKINELVHKMLKEDVKINSIVPSTEYNYRNKITLHGNEIGMYKDKSNEIVKIDKCYLINDEMNIIIDRIHKYTDKNKVRIDELTIKCTSLNEIMISIYGNLDYDHFLNEFKDIKVIYINNQLVSKDRYIKEKILNKEFNISNHSFFQVNMYNTENLYNLVINSIKDKNYKKALDLYCGTGTIGILISEYVDEVVGIEEVKDAITDANNNKEINQVNNISFICGKVEDNINLFNDIGLVIVDPPRAGLDIKTRDNIKRINPDTIIYVSCDPATLMRDLNDLKDKYLIKEITPVDMFPKTYHCESVCILEKK